MTDLTEQWKKGELPSGEYYIIDDLGLHTTDRYYPSHGFGAELPQAVLAPVPSYDEWKKAYECVVSENEEITTLKDLLKECRDVIKNVDTYYGNYDSTNGYLVINKIDEALR